MLLSVLICTLDDRRKWFRRLSGEIARQVSGGGFEKQVEVKGLSDNRQMTIGRKRNLLMRAAQGEYVCFVDDDDWVAPCYVCELVNALSSGPDCAGIQGRIEHPKDNWRTFYHSIKYKSYTEDPKGYYRPPNHLNPVRKRIAERFPFNHVSHGEDTEYALKMLHARVLKVERMVEQPIYYYVPSMYGLGDPGQVRMG